MSFGQPFVLIALLLVPAAVGLIVWAARSRQRALDTLAQPHLLAGLLIGVSGAGRRWRTVLWVVALGFAVIAMARPQWGEREIIVEQEGVQVVVVLDVSASMLAQDVKPDRLTRAKLEMIELMARLDGDEVGLVLFSGSAFIQLPLTSDYLTARRFLDAANTDSISRPGTVIGRAIEMAALAFDEDREGAKVILLMTDGEDSETDPVAAAGEAAKEGITIFTVGFGSAQGEPVPDLGRRGNVIGFKTDRAGAQVLSRLDEETLRAVADAAGGSYFRAGGAAAAIANRIDDLQASRLDSREEIQRIERFQIFLAIAVLALIVAELIPESTLRTQSTRKEEAFG